MMNAKFQLIDLFSRRPSLSLVAYAALCNALESDYPALNINPDTAVIIRQPAIGQSPPQTLMDSLRECFATGKTPCWKEGQNTLVLDPAVPGAAEIDIAQLAVLVDSVSLGLKDMFLQAMVDFWDRPGKDGVSPCKQLAQALELHNLSQPQSGSQDGRVQVQADFEKRALQALEAQLATIHGVLSLGLGDFDEIERYLAKVTDITPLLEDGKSNAAASRLSRLDQLPGWLSAASPTDRLDYSRRMSALAVTSAHSAGKSWNDDLPPILDYAIKTLQDSLREDHPQATWLTLDDVSVHIAKVVAVPAPSAGQFIPLGSVEHLSKSVATFALENLSSLPSGTITLSMRDGGPLPGWLTPGYLKHLITRVDIGRTYPALLRRYLITDEKEAARRQLLFADQLHVQLPLKALEQKMRGEGGMTQAGYRLVCSLMETPRAATGSVLRTLAWIAQPDAVADEVCNMFVIGAEDTAVGPFVLYRPFACVPLTEFATWATLRDAIALDGELQDEVLIWMTEHARRRYSNGGFNQPHIVRFAQGSEFAPLQTPAPAQLSVAAVQTDIMPVLFNANARALVNLADRESVSNAESRWTLLKRGGWLILDAVMPFLSGSVGSALWLVQLMGSVDQVLVAEKRKAGLGGFAAWNNLLLTVSMILLHQGFTPRLTASASTRVSEPTEVEADLQTQSPVEEASSSALLTPPAAEMPLLDFSWSSVNHRLSAEQMRHLQRLKLSPEPPLGSPSPEPGREGLHQHNQRWNVRLDSGVYEVGFLDEDVYIVDPQNPHLRGPRLQYVDGVWALDLSLKLRGGGPKRNARQLSLENAATLKRVTEREAVLEQRKKELFEAFEEWHQAYRRIAERLTSERIEHIETELNELLAIMEEKKQLQLQLRPADRAGEKTLAVDLQAAIQRVTFFEAVLFDNMQALVRRQLVQLKTVAGDKVTPENITQYLALFEDLLAMQNRGVHWSVLREGLWQQLRDVPKFGEKSWRSEVLEFQRCELLTHLDWRINRLWVELELSFGRDNILAADGSMELMVLRTDEALHAAFSSHAEMEKPNDYMLAEQIDVLESSLREYQRLTLIATCTRQSMPEALNADYFGPFLQDLSWVSDRAEKRLSDLIRESAEPSEHPVEYTPRVKQPRKRVFRTRTHRTLVGRIREGEPDVPGEVVDVTTATAVEKIISTYHLHENGEWVEVETVRAARPGRRESLVALTELKKRAGTALERVEPEISYARRQASRASEPADMQDILVQKADHLSGLADRLCAKATDPGLAPKEASAVQALVAQLRSAASRLVDEGRVLRIAMIKAQPPTAARLSYLAREREVNIARFEGRKNLSGRKRNDFLQEYLIRDQEQRVLWWAHFHYARENAAAEAFTAAHLKLPEQRFIGYKAQLKAAKDNKEVVSIYRSAIGKEVARQLFLSLDSVGAGSGSRADDSPGSP